MRAMFLCFALAASSALAQPEPAPAPAPPPPPALELDLSSVEAVLANFKLHADTHLDDLTIELGGIELPRLAGLDGMLYAQSKSAGPALAPLPPLPPTPPRGSGAYVGSKFDANAPEEHLYRRGQFYADRKQWDKAIEAFDAAAQKKGSKADGAMYWKAYSLRRIGKGTEAGEVIKELERSYPKSRWLNDAKALEIEIRQASGRPISPEEESDEDLKLMAIHSLAQSDPTRAVPLLEKVIFGSKSSPRLREQALFVLSQTKEPRTREILLQVAKGKSNPDLQLKALQFLGMTNASAELAAIYAAETDKSVKRTIIDMLTIQKDPQPLIDIARNEKDLELKKEAIRRLAHTGRKEAMDLLVEILEK